LKRALSTFLQVRAVLFGAILAFSFSALPKLPKLFGMAEIARSEQRG
jgi:hypothetical protein